MPAVTLVSMPFGPLRSPSLGLGLLKEGLRRKGISSRVRNFTLDYAALIGAELYISLSSEYPFAVDLIGEWIFSGALGTGDPETYVRQVIEGGHPDHRQRIAGRLGGAAAARNAAVELRKGTGAFIDACVDRILEDAPRVVGFSSVFEQTAASLAAARRIKERSPGTLIVFGGANAEDDERAWAPLLDAAGRGETGRGPPHRREAQARSSSSALAPPKTMRRARSLNRLPTSTGSVGLALLFPTDSPRPGAHRPMSTLTSPDATQTLRPVSELWYTRCPVPTASSIAISQGWLDDEFVPDDIAVASLRASADSAVRESHFNHSQADSFRQGGNIPPIWTRSRGSDVRLIGLSGPTSTSRSSPCPVAASPARRTQGAAPGPDAARQRSDRLLPRHGAARLRQHAASHRAEPR